MPPAELYGVPVILSGDTTVTLSDDNVALTGSGHDFRDVAGVACPCIRPGIIIWPGRMPFRSRITSGGQRK